MSSFGSGPAKLYSWGRKHSSGNPQPTRSSLSWFLASQVTRMVGMFSPLWSQKFTSPRSPPCRAFSQHCAMKASFYRDCVQRNVKRAAVLRIRDIYPPILIFSQPGSWILDPPTTKKRGWGKIYLLFSFFVVTNFTELFT